MTNQTLPQQPLPTDWSGKHIGLLGFGIENQALLGYLIAQGAKVTICDRNEDLAHQSLPESVKLRLGPGYLDRLTDFELVFRTPAIPFQTPAIQAAARSGVVISSQIKLFFERCPARIIGVTGTKGKSTTASLITLILELAAEAGQLPGKVYLAGNIGKAAVDLLDRLTADDLVVLELSSFQLEDLTKSPELAVVLAVTTDHLDYHHDLAEYQRAKKPIVLFQKPTDYAVLNLDSVASLAFAEESVAQTYYFSRRIAVDQGVFVHHSQEIVLRLPDRADQPICTVADIKLVGAYNLENVAAAALTAYLAGAKLDHIRQGITSFTGLHHRLEFVAELKAIRYYDDSKATTPEATEAAVLAFDQPITVIVGGSSKGADFGPLVSAIKQSQVKKVICIGQEGERIYRLLLADQSHIRPVQSTAHTMAEIVAQATELTEPGGIVLLSPAAASFDMFNNAEDRGDQFQAAVKALTE